MLVSIIMPAFMGEKWIARAIKSVIRQSYPIWELIIVDSNSSDNTAKIALSFVKLDSRIHYYNVYDVGTSGARNAAIKYSTGEYIAYLDVDDEYLTNHLEARVEYFKQNSADFVFGAVFESKESMLKVYQGSLNGNETDCVLPLMVMHHRKCFSVGLFKEELVFEEDLDLWNRIMKNFKISKFNKPVTAIYYVHGKGMHSLYEQGGEQAVIQFRDRYKKK